MYFIPQRNAWYRSVAHINSFVRYVGTLSVVVLLLCGWWFGIYPIIDATIRYDQAQCMQLEQKIIQRVRSEKTCKGLSCSMQKLNTTLAEYTATCSGDFCSTQLTALIDIATKSGIQITSYTNQKEIKKSWCTCHDVQIGFTASLDSIVSLLQKLSESNALIECDQVTFNCTQNGLFTTTCMLRFISL